MRLERGSQQKKEKPNLPFIKKNVQLRNINVLNLKTAMGNFKQGFKDFATVIFYFV